MKKLRFFLLITCVPIFTYAQKTPSKAGILELGTRTTFSTFGSTGNIGTGFGGQFRLRLSNKINTEWFADFFSEDIDGLAKRNDKHIGWSVMIYPLNTMESKISPYIIAGHCFDYTIITPTNVSTKDRSNETKDRWSSATQLGIGTSFALSDQFNLSVAAQYMVHLGNDLHIDVHEHHGEKEIHIDEGHGSDFSLEGHLLFTMSLNYKIADLW